MFKNIFKNLLKNPARLGKYNRGVSLIELLVVIAIFMIISSMTIFSYNDFKSSLSIQNLADDIGLSVRKAQNYATGVIGSRGYFSYAYGINFSTKSDVILTEESGNNPSIGNDSTVNSSNKSFVLFIDRDNSGYYNNEYVQVCDSETNSNCLEYLELLSIKSNDVISRIDLILNSGKSVTLKNEDQIDLLFKRPNPEPVFCYRKNNATKCDNDSGKISNINIKISSERDSSISKTVTISNNGQISVDL